MIIDSLLRNIWHSAEIRGRICFKVANVCKLQLEFPLMRRKDVEQSRESRHTELCFDVGELRLFFGRRDVEASSYRLEREPICHVVEYFLTGEFQLMLLICLEVHLNAILAPVYKAIHLFQQLWVADFITIALGLYMRRAQFLRNRRKGFRRS